MLEPLLLAATRVSTFDLERPLTNASGFFFARDERLFLVTSRHVVIDEPTDHHPSHLQIELHTNEDNLAESTGFSIPLFEDGKSLWRQGTDSGGEIDIALIEIDRSALPETTLYQAFTPEHLADITKSIEIGSALLVVGFPLGFHDTLHHMPVARQASIASAFGLRFKGEGYFLTDARTHRGSSGAPIVMRLPADDKRELPWLLLGVHSSRLDVNRDLEIDEALGLNCAWYSDILMTLSE
ncbi:S1-C subfamily serine protease [Pseudomonas sp. TE3786]